MGDQPDYQPRRPSFGPKPKPPAFKPWKPDKCADCGKPHPSYSRNGREGPWRCKRCDRRADPTHPSITIREPEPPPPAPKPDNGAEQGRLI